MITIEILGVFIQEPMATFTDLLIAAICFFAYYKLQQSQKKEKVFIYFKFYFVLMGIAMILSGLLGHAFMYYIDFEWKLPGWLISMLAIMSVELAAIEHSKNLLNSSVFKAFQIINGLELLIFIFLTFYFLDFFFVAFHSGYGLIVVVFSLQSFLYIKTKNLASKNILIGIGMALSSVLFFANEVSLHRWFNHISVSHVFMGLSVYFFYKGVMEINIKSTHE